MKTPEQILAAIEEALLNAAPGDYLHPEAQLELLADLELFIQSDGHDEIQSRIYRGELDATDADGVQGMKDLG